MALELGLSGADHNPGLTIIFSCTDVGAYIAGPRFEDSLNTDGLWHCEVFFLTRRQPEAPRLRDQKNATKLSYRALPAPRQGP